MLGGITVKCETEKDFKPWGEANRAAQAAAAADALKIAAADALSPATAPLVKRPAAWPDWRQSPTQPRG